MELMTPKGLEQSPQKSFTDRPKKVEEVKLQPISVDINLLDVIKLGIRKAIENKAFGQYQLSTGKVIAVASGGSIGIGLFANINWGLLLTGNVFEILKLIFAVGSVVVALVWKN